MRKLLIALSIALLIVLASCENNIFYPSADTWEAGGNVYYTFSEAMLAMSQASKDVEGTLPKSRRITLLKDVTGDEHGESITIPSTFPADMDLCIDFNGKQYQFESDAAHFLTVESGKTIEIINGTSIIPATAKEGPAVKVTSSGTTIENHVIIDNRPKKALLETTGGSVELKSGTLEGSVSISGGSQVVISGAEISATSVTISDDQGRSSALNVSSGKLTTEELEVGDNGKVAITGATVEIKKANLKEGATATVTGGTVNFSESIDKDSTADFQISGGEISNPHEIDSTVTAAIVDGGGGESVTHTITHKPVKHEGYAATCHAAGLETYWSCEECTSLFSDEECLHEITEPIVIPQLEHVPATVWTSSDYSHYHICTLCGDRLDEAFHEWSEEVDGKKHCLVCGREIDLNVHNHWFPLEPEKDDYRRNQNGHWLECSCGLRQDEAAHTFGEWYLSEDETYLIHECSVCGYKEVWYEDSAERIDVGFGTVVMPTLPPMACGDLKYSGEDGVYTFWFEPYGNSPTDYSMFCYYKIGIKKYYPEQNEDGTYTIESDKTFTVYLQVATKGGTITKSAVVTP